MISQYVIFKIWLSVQLIVCITLEENNNQAFDKMGNDNYNFYYN